MENRLGGKTSPMTSVIGIQCRALSSRLPFKAFLDFDGQPMLSYLFRRLLERFEHESLALLTTQHHSDDVTANLAPKDVRVIRGSQENVRSRYVTLAQDTGADYVVRLTADNPFVIPALVEKAIEFASINHLDYVSNKLGGWVPKGLDVEVISRRAILYDGPENLSREVMEHVTPEIRRLVGIEKFSGGCINYLGAEIGFPLSIDTADEYILARLALLNGAPFITDPSIDDGFQFCIVG